LNSSGLFYSNGVVIKNCTFIPFGVQVEVISQCPLSPCPTRGKSSPFKNVLSTAGNVLV
jgi:hypothetical protein